jgi:hypothetical protein
MRKMTDVMKGRFIGAGLPFVPGMDIPPIAKRVYAKIPAKPLVKKGIAQVTPYSGPLALSVNVGQAAYAGYTLHQSGWRLHRRSGRPYKIKSNRVSGRKSGRGGPARDPKATNRFARRRRKLIPRKGRKCPNGYRYDPKRKMCVYKGL